MPLKIGNAVGRDPNRRPAVVRLNGAQSPSAQHVAGGDRSGQPMLPLPKGKSNTVLSFALWVWSMLPTDFSVRVSRNQGAAAAAEAIGKPGIFEKE